MSDVSFYDNKYRDGEEVEKESKRLALKFLPAGELDVLDLGCGSGMCSETIAGLGHKVRGIDVSAEAIEKYNARGLDGQVMDVEVGLDFPDESFDVVFSSEVIEHLVHYQRMLQESFRVLRPSGRLILTTPNSAFWIYRLLGLFGRTVSELQHPMHLQFFSQRSLRQALLDEGFTIERSSGHNIYLMVPDPPATVRPLFRKLGLIRELRFTTQTYFWHLSNLSSTLNPWFAANLLFVAQKPSKGDGH